MAQLTKEKPLPFLRPLQLGEVSAGSGNCDCLSLRVVAFKLDETRCAQPTPAAIELLDPVMHVVSPVALRIERLPHPRPHQLQIVRMEFGLHSLFSIKDARFSKPVKALG